MKSLLLTLVLLIPGILIAQERFYELKVSLNLKQPETAYLVKNYGYTTQQNVDSISSDNGKFVFRGIAKKYPYKMTVVINKDFRTFYIHEGKIGIIGDDSLKNAHVSGSVNEEYARYLEFLSPYQAESKMVDARFKAISPEGYKEPGIAKLLMSEIERLGAMMDSLNLAYYKQNPKSFLTILANQPSLLMQDVGPAIGSQAPDFTQNDVNGKPVSLSDFRGKYVLIDFWASWCGPCRAENPNFVRCYNDFKSRNFTILGVSLDKPGAKDAWLSAIAKDGLPWTQVSDLNFWDNAVARLYEIKTIPMNFLIDPNGKVIAKNLRGNLAAFLESNLPRK